MLGQKSRELTTPPESPNNATTSGVSSGRWLETPSGGEAAFGQPGLPAVHGTLRAENRSFCLNDPDTYKVQRNAVYLGQNTARCVLS